MAILYVCDGCGKQSVVKPFTRFRFGEFLQEKALVKPIWEADLCSSCAEDAKGHDPKNWARALPAAHAQEPTP